ncbi:MAG: Nramp family divalent metal transporter [Bacteroidetes bacterium]|nr:Nramp family divalent metal transporter [Bacteroidota bacterium]
MKLFRHVDAARHSLDEVHSSVDTNKKGFFRSFLAFAGPGYLVSVGYMDPGNWATDIAGGSKFGFTLVWVLLMSNLMAVLLQSFCARLGIVYGKDLAQASREHYPAFINIPLYVLAEIAIAACDLAEVLGLAIGLNLLFGIPLLWGVTIALFDCILLLMILRLGIRKMEAFIISMVSIIGMCFAVEMFFAKPEPLQILTGIFPSIPNAEALYITMGIIGATVMPHNLYLHSSLVQTRRYSQDDEGKRRALRFNIFDTALALNFALFINASILILAAVVFHGRGLYEIADITDAHKLLEPLLGTKLAPILFAIALIASGQSSTITGTLAGQIVMEGYLNLRIVPWLRRLMTRLFAVVPAFLVIYFMGDDKTGDLLILSQVILSIQLGFAVIPLIHWVSDKNKMGNFVISPTLKILAWLVAIIIITLNVKLVYEEEVVFISSLGFNSIWVPIILILSAAAVLLLLYITIEPLLTRKLIIKEVALPHNMMKELNIESLKKYSNIAVTVDFTSVDEKTISFALKQGGKSSTYNLIHIVESAGAIFSGSKSTDLESRVDLKSLEKYSESLKEAGYKTNVLIGYGGRVKSIVKFVRETNSEILVMGGHGHRGLKDIIFGSTVTNVRHRLNIPVIIVK